MWVNHEKFHGAQDDPGDSISFTIPTISGASAGNTGLGLLWDMFGLPPLAIPDDIPVSALPFRAYTKIYNDWFRSATLQDSIIENTGNGPDLLVSATAGAGQVNRDLFKRGKRFDYFTSCLPAPQRGTAVSLPLGTSADVVTDQTDLNDLGIYSSASSQYQLMGHSRGAVLDLDSGTTGAETGKMYADLSTALAPDVNDIRLAFATQHILERDARSGTRYVESLKARWGVTSPDFRLQRAEYLGGGSTAVQISPVQQTTHSDICPHSEQRQAIILGQNHS